MTPEPLHFRRLRWWSLVICIPLLAGAAHLHLPSFWGGFIGDSAVYYAMADSLAHDSDLRYTREDLLRIRSEWPDGPQGVLLVADRTDPDIIHYAKPFLYSLAAAPLVRFLGANGLLLFNAFCFAAIVFMGFHAFPDRERQQPYAPILWSTVFWMISAVPAYVFNIAPDLFNGTLLMAGLLPWVRHKQSTRPLRMLNLSAFIITLAALSRPPNALFLLLPAWSLVFERSNSADPSSNPRTRIIRIVTGLALLTGTVLVGFSIGYLLSDALTGQGFAYSGFRKRIVGRFPFEAPGITFLNTGNMMSTETTSFIFNPDTLLHNLHYFFTGRFAGLIPYFFPAAVTLIAALILGPKAPDPTAATPSRTPLWMVLAGLFLFHIVYIPSNWHGGSCAVGNRYLISWLPGFYLLLRRPPPFTLSAATAAIAAFFTGTIMLSPASAFQSYRDIPKRPVMQLFPMEITLLESWPVDDLSHRRVDFGSYFMYFADDFQFGKELDGFWVRGRSRADGVMRCWKPEPEIRVKIRNGGKPAKIKGRVGSLAFSRHAEAGEFFEISGDPGRPVKAYNLAGNASYCYPVQIAVSAGFIPRFVEPGSTDHRFLGCHVILETNP